MNKGCNNKLLLKLEIISIKILPFLLFLMTVSSLIMEYFNVNSSMIKHITMVVIFIFIMISSFSFKFCLLHRIPLYYILIIELFFNCYYYDLLHINYNTFLCISMIISFLFINLIIYFYARSIKKTRYKLYRKLGWR
jgi:hypothetical protein